MRKLFDWDGNEAGAGSQHSASEKLCSTER